MILMRSNIPPNFNPVAIGAPQFGETRLQIARTPNTTVKQQKTLQPVNGSSCGGGDGKLLIRGRRCSLAKVRLGNPG